MMARQSLLPRWMHRLYAKFRGYFWLPCPICGRPFGGHEKGGTLLRDVFNGWMVCRGCTDEAERRNRRNGFIPPPWRRISPIGPTA